MEYYVKQSHFLQETIRPPDCWISDFMVLSLSVWADNSHVIILVQVHLISSFLRKLLLNNNDQSS